MRCAAVLAGARPVAVGDLGDDLAALLERFEDDADVEMLAERVLDADLDVVEVDEDGDVETVLMGQGNFLSSFYSAESCHFRPARPPGAMYRKFKPPAF